MKLKYSFLSLICCLIFMVILTSSTSDDKTTKIGVILDLSSRLGKEQHISMQIAVEQFNKTNIGVSTHLIEYNQTALQVAIAAEALLKQKEVDVIIVGIENWQTTSIVSQIGALYQIPILSLAASPPITSPFPSLQWPFLVNLSHNATVQVRNIASIIKSFHWRRVIVVYEENTCFGMISLLTKALQNTRTKIEQHLVLPPYTSSTNNPRGAIKKELKLVEQECYSRVFIILGISLPYVSPLFEEAKEMGLMRNDSVWITTESITNFLPSFSNPTLLNMDGVIGVMVKFDNSTLDYQIFEAMFWKNFVEQYKNEIYNKPSYEALLSYDAINLIVKAKHSLLNNTSDADSNSRSFLKEILQSNFPGLSGQVFFDHDHNMVRNESTKLANVVGANYYNALDLNADDVEDADISTKLATKVKWPGNHNGGDIRPKGWKMPTQTKKLRIGVPISNTCRGILIDYHGHKLNGSIFPKGAALASIHNNNFDGFCIRIFDEVVQLLDYDLPYQLIPFNASYTDLVKSVYDKTFDAAIGDITILANRAELVDFTLPYTETGLSIVLPTDKPKNSHGPWFIKPFTSKMWVLTFFVFLYTMIVIWILEHGHNKDFEGSWKDQISATVWFAFNSLYFAQREPISSNLARVVVILWLFIVLIITQSYTANLTSLMTIDRLNEATINVEMLQRTNAKVGYENSTFIAQLLEDVLKFHPSNIIPIEGDFRDFHQAFQAKKISAAILEDLYARLLITQDCNQYTMTLEDYRFGGFGFVFPKGSPIAVDVSKAILNLTENDHLRKLEKQYISTNSKCISTADDTDSNNNNSGEQSSLSLSRFIILFSISGATTTICLLASFVPWYRKRRNLQVVVPINN